MGRARGIALGAACTRLDAGRGQLRVLQRARRSHHERPRLHPARLRRPGQSGTRQRAQTAVDAVHELRKRSALGGQQWQIAFRVGVLTPVLDHDGSDLAAALRTIEEIGDAEALARAVHDAFGGASVEIQSDDTQFRLQMHMPGVLRPLEAAELSDGTLRFLDGLRDQSNVQLRLT